MAIADTINSIRTHLTEDYEGLENLGATIPEDKNIENIVSCLEEVYNNIPKTTDTGTNLSLNTIKGKMNIIPKGDTSQGGTPTPDTPIDIEVVTGTQEVKVENVNLCKNAIINATSGAYIDILYVDMDLKPNTTYTISFIGATNNKIYLNENITTPQYITCNGSRQSLTFTTKSNLDKTNSQQYKPSANGWILFKNNSSNTETPSFDNVQLEYGSTATDYVEHAEQTQLISLGSIELAKIGNYQDYLYKTSGKNLLPNYRLTTRTTNNVTYTNNGNGTINLSGTSNAYTQFIDDTSFTLPAGTYTICSPNLSGYITLNLRSTDGNTTYANTGATTTSKLYATFTLAEETEMKFRVVMQNNSQTNVSIMPMIISGEFTTMPTYEPYGSDKWYKKARTIEQVITSNYLDNLYLFTLQSINSYGIANFLLQNISNTEESLYDYTGLCNYLSTQNSSIATEQNEGILYQPRAVYVRIKSTTASTTTELKTYVDSLNTSGNPLKIYRPLATANDIEITNSNLIEQLNNIEKAQSYNGITNISSNGNLPIVLGVSALKGE